MRVSLHTGTVRPPCMHHRPACTNTQSRLKARTAAPRSPPKHWQPSTGSGASAHRLLLGQHLSQGCLHLFVADLRSRFGCAGLGRTGCFIEPRGLVHRRCKGGARDSLYNWKHSTGLA